MSLHVTKIVRLNIDLDLDVLVKQLTFFINLQCVTTKVSKCIRVAKYVEISLVDSKLLSHCCRCYLSCCRFICCYDTCCL